MDWYSNKGKSGLAHELTAKGFSVRKAEKAVNAFFDAMAQALARGETVDIPGAGQLRVQVRQGKRRQRLMKVRDIHSHIVRYRAMKFPGSRRVVKFYPDPNLRIDPCAEFPPPTRPIAACPWLFRDPNPERAEASKLAAELLKQPVNAAVLDQLQAAADRNPRAPGRLLDLLRRLRHLGYWPPTVQALEHELSHNTRW